jgi:biopolymer transport protein ExbB/TolQ
MTEIVIAVALMVAVPLFCFYADRATQYRNAVERLQKWARENV